MQEEDQLEDALLGDATCDVTELLRPLMQAPAERPAPTDDVPGLVIGKLLALVEEGRTPLVTYPGQSTPGALMARSVVDLHSVHVGQDVVLGFEQGRGACPIVLGVVQGQAALPFPQEPGRVTVDADGQRMVVAAQKELVLRCGKASVSLRCDGRVEIRGETVLTEAVTANRVRGGTVELN